MPPAPYDEGSSLASSVSLIGQFDKKFCVFFREKDKSIIFFDQHAVHERILYEYYQELLYKAFFSNLESSIIFFHLILLHNII